MTVSEKIKTVDGKIEIKKLNTIETDKLLKFQAYHQEMLVNMNFWQVKKFYQRKYNYKKPLQSKNLNTRH